jgi:formylglycine-generating enzyme required for sulfatase activity
MIGNVWEWCHSLYKPYPYKARDGREDETAAGNRIIRGGSYANDRFAARCACRLNGAPDYLYLGIGFRVAASLISPV